MTSIVNDNFSLYQYERAILDDKIDIISKQTFGKKDKKFTVLQGQHSHFSRRLGRDFEFFESTIKTTGDCLPSF
jgi:hypothetical protein